MTTGLRRLALICVPVMLAACAQKDQISEVTEPFDGIGEAEIITLVGNEPFWSIEIDGENATYSSPEVLDGVTFTVTRFAGNNGLGYSGQLDGEDVQIAVTPGTCSDTMSDRDYPFTATVEWGERSLKGCGYTDAQPFTGDAEP